MGQTTDEITLGGGTLYVADYGESMPTDLTATPSGNWTAIGYTEAGAVLDVATQTAEARVDELFYPVAEATTGQTATLAAVIAQFTFDVLLRAFNGGSVDVDSGPPVVNTFKPPAPDGIADFAALFVYDNHHGSAGSPFYSHVQMPKVRNISTINVTFQESDAVLRQVPLELKMYPDSSITDANGNELPFQILEYESAS